MRTARARNFNRIRPAGGTHPLSDPNVRAHARAWLSDALKRSSPAGHVHVGGVDDIHPSERTVFFAPAQVSASHHLVRPFDGTTLPLASRSCRSLSTLGIVERLGPAIAPPDGDVVADLNLLNEFARVLAPDGVLLIACPVGRPAVVPGSHRVYDVHAILDAFEGFDLEEFRLIDPAGGTPATVLNPDLSIVGGYTAACGCFWLRKSSPAPAR